MVDGVQFAFEGAGKDDRDYVQCLDRGLFSHVVAQASGLASLLGQDGAPIEHTWSVCQFDDTTMWVSRKGIEKPPADARHLRNLYEKVAKCEQRQGKNIHMQVLNQLEDIFVCKRKPGNSSYICGAHVYSQSRVLPCANATTVHDRFADW